MTATTGKPAVLLPLVLLVSVVVGLSRGYIITLEDITDQNSGVWTDISCRHYQNSTEYVEAKGCQKDTVVVNPVDPRWMPSNETDDFFDGQEGLWGPCSSLVCEFVYYGGPQNPRPKNISVYGLFSGSGSLTVDTRRGVSSGSWTNLGSLEASDTTDFETVEFLSLNTEDNQDEDLNHFVYRFVLTTTGNTSLALIDRIEIDLGADVPEPPTTEPPVTTPKVEYTLDIKDHVRADSEWMSVTCNYAENREDFWVYGCPNDLSVDDDNDEDDEEEYVGGYWTTCHAYNCDFIFSSGKIGSITRPRVKSLSVEGVFQNDAGITLSAKSRGAFSKYHPLMTVDAEDFENGTTWTQDIPNYCNNDIFNISIFGDAANVLVDKIVVTLYDESDVCTNPDPSATTTKKPTPTTPSAGGEGDETTTEGAGVNIQAPFLTSVFVVFISLSFYTLR